MSKEACNHIYLNSVNQWAVVFDGKQVTKFSVATYGESAEDLAAYALGQLTAGTFDAETLMLDVRMQFSARDTASVIGIRESELVYWCETGILRGREVKPPRRMFALRTHRYTMFEIKQAQLRIANLKS